MGLAASMARLLALMSRASNLELYNEYMAQLIAMGYYGPFPPFSG
jgi:hypothetical protein